jgi:flagellar hook-length control protein FliK
MDTGQMMAVMQQMPVSTNVSPNGDAGLSADLIEGAFAGLLQGMSMQNSVQKLIQPVVVGEALPQGLKVPVEASVMMDSAMTALLVMAENSEAPVKADVKVAVEEKVVTDELSDHVDLTSQNVTPGMDALQLAMMLTQHHDARPESDGASGSSSEFSQAVRQVVCDAPVQVGETVTAQPVVMTAMPVAMQESVQTGADIDGVQVDSPVVATADAGKEPLVNTSVGVVPAKISQNEKAVTERDMRAAVKPSTTARMTEGQDKVVLVEKSTRKTDGFFMQISDQQPIATVTQARQEPDAINRPGAIVMPVVSAEVVQQQPEVVLQNKAGADKGISQPEVKIATHVNAAQPVSAILQSVPVPQREADQGTELPEVAVDLAGPQEQLQNTRSAIPKPAVAETVIQMVDASTSTTRVELRETEKIQQSEKPDTGKMNAAAISGENKTGNNENETPEGGAGGSFQPHVFTHQVKTGEPVTASSVTTAVQNGAAQTATVPEQVVHQVRERFATHETKPGSEQIVLRLNPEHLGELKVNLSLDGQRLKVEIVAENRMVRDSLMQHTDALKESLSRQNITMDSFEVTTGGNGSAESGRNQGAWRELAQQRQYNTWMPDGGYRLAQQVSPALAAYQAKSEHTMVDLHF